MQTCKALLYEKAFDKMLLKLPPCAFTFSVLDGCKKKTHLKLTDRIWEKLRAVSRIRQTRQKS